MFHLGKSPHGTWHSIINLYAEYCCMQMIKRPKKNAPSNDVEILHMLSFCKKYKFWEVPSVEFKSHPCVTDFVLQAEIILVWNTPQIQDFLATTILHLTVTLRPTYFFIIHICMQYAATVIFAQHFYWHHIWKEHKLLM